MVKKLFEIETTRNLGTLELRGCLEDAIGITKVIGVKEIKDNEPKNIIIEIQDKFADTKKMLRLRIKNNEITQVLADEEKVTYIRTIEENYKDLKVIIQEK